MEIVVQLRSELAELVNRPGASLRTVAAENSEAVRLADALARYDVDLSPQHPGAADPQLARWFVVRCGDRDAQSCERIAAALRQAGADAYLKPDAEPAAPGSA